MIRFSNDSLGYDSNRGPKKFWIFKSPNKIHRVLFRPRTYN